MPQSFESRSAASKKGWQTRKSKKEYYSAEQIQARREASRKSTATRANREYEPEEATKYIERSKLVMDRIESELNRLNYELFKEEIDNWDADMLNVSDELKNIKRNDYNTIHSIFYGAIARDGEDAVAMRIEANAPAIIDALVSVLWDSGSKAKISMKEEFQGKVAEITRILNGGMLTQKESYDVTNISEAINEGE